MGAPVAAIFHRVRIGIHVGHSLSRDVSGKPGADDVGTDTGASRIPDCAYVRTHLHFGEETHHDELVNPVVGISAFIGMIVHTFFDGVAIGAGFIVSPGVGLLIFLAVLLHKIPDGFTISSIVITSGHSKKSALGAASALGGSTLIGVLAVHLLGGSVSYALPISTGSTLYVAATDLMPEVNREKGAKMAILVFAGIALFFLARRLATI